MVVLKVSSPSISEECVLILAVYWHHLFKNLLLMFGLGSLV